MDTITISGMAITGIDTSNSITYISSPSYTYGKTIGSVSIATSIPSQISSLNIDTSTFKIQLPEEWVNQFPDFDRVQKMCEEYPGLKIALEKFKTVYKLVKDHYDTPEDKRPRP
jgi:hypothetical protein